MFGFIKNVFGKGSNDKQPEEEDIDDVIARNKKRQSKFDQGFGIAQQQLNEDLERVYDQNVEMKRKMREKMLIQKSGKNAADTDTPGDDLDKSLADKKGKGKIAENKDQPQNNNVQTEENQLLKKGYDDEINKIFGPNEKKIKKSLNKKLRKKFKQQQKFEEKKLVSRIAENEQKVYDFIYDFSSSDYECISEGDLEHLNEYIALNEMNLQNRMLEFAHSPGMSVKKKRNHEMSPDDDEISQLSQTQLNNNESGQTNKGFHLRRLLDSYKKFEKRKVLKPIPHF